MEDITETDESYEWRGLRLRPGRDWDFGSHDLLDDDGGDRHQYGERVSIRVWERWLDEGEVDQAEVQDAWQAMDWPNDPDNALDKGQWIVLFRAALFPVPDEAITIYRAECGPEGAVGLCWTDDLGKAEAWASRHQAIIRGSHGRSRILSAVAQPSQIIAVFGSDGIQRLQVDGEWVDVRHAEIIAIPSEIELIA